MLKIILQNKKTIAPFNEPALDLRIHNKPLLLLQRNILVPYTTHEVELPAGACLPLSQSYTPSSDLYLADLWFYPEGPDPDVEPLVVDFKSLEVGYLHGAGAG